MTLRVGQGVDVHRFAPQRPLILGELARQDVKNRNERQFAVAEPS